MLRGTEPPEQLREYVLRMSSNEGANNNEEQERAVAALCHVQLEGHSELISQVILINPLHDSAPLRGSLPDSVR